MANAIELDELLPIYSLLGRGATAPYFRAMDNMVEICRLGDQIPPPPIPYTGDTYYEEYYVDQALMSKFYECVKSAGGLNFQTFYDLGCGEGRLSVPFLLAGKLGHGIDISTKLNDHLKEHPHYKYSNLDVTRITRESGLPRLDAVLMNPAFGVADSKLNSEFARAATILAPVVHMIQKKGDGSCNVERLHYVFNKYGYSFFPLDDIVFPIGKTTSSKYYRKYIDCIYAVAIDNYGEKHTMHPGQIEMQLNTVATLGNHRDDWGFKTLPVRGEPSAIRHRDNSRLVLSLLQCQDIKNEVLDNFGTKKEEPLIAPTEEQIEKEKFQNTAKAPPTSSNPLVEKRFDEKLVERELIHRDHTKPKKVYDRLKPPSVATPASTYQFLKDAHNIATEALGDAIERTRERKPRPKNRRNPVQAPGNRTPEGTGPRSMKMDANFASFQNAVRRSQEASTPARKERWGKRPPLSRQDNIGGQAHPTGRDVVPGRRPQASPRWHSHICITCSVTYQHKHRFNNARHTQFPYQCPNKNCANYFGKGDSIQQRNTTESCDFSKIDANN